MRSVVGVSSRKTNWSTPGMIHHIQIIGEAASKLTPSFRKTHHDIPWPQIIKMRHVLVHDYFGIDLAEVWAAVERDLPSLKKQVSTILKHASKRSQKG